MGGAQARSGRRDARTGCQLLPPPTCCRQSMQVLGACWGAIEERAGCPPLTGAPVVLTCRVSELPGCVEMKPNFLFCRAIWGSARVLAIPS